MYFQVITLKMKIHTLIIGTGSGIFQQETQIKETEPFKLQYKEDLMIIFPGSSWSPSVSSRAGRAGEGEAHQRESSLSADP